MCTERPAQSLSLCPGIVSDEIFIHKHNHYHSHVDYTHRYNYEGVPSNLFWVWSLLTKMAERQGYKEYVSKLSYKELQKVSFPLLLCVCVRVRGSQLSFF